jgi:hypothetical protein
MKRTGCQKLDLIKYLMVLYSVFLFTWIPSCALLPPQVDNEPDRRTEPPQGEPLPVSEPGTPYRTLSARAVADFEKDPSQPGDIIGFGESVGISGDWMVVGASDWSGNHKGAIFVYHNQNGVWSEHSRLTASNRDDGFQYNMYFGKRVAIHGTTIAASARGADHEEIGDNTGAIYIFELDGDNWIETAILEAPNPEAHFGLGYLIAFDGEKLAASGEVGSRGLYVFERNGSIWTAGQRLELPGMGENDMVRSLVMHGDWLSASYTRVFRGEGEIPDISQFQEKINFFRRVDGQWQNYDRLIVPEAGKIFIRPAAIYEDTLVLTGGFPSAMDAGVYVYKLIQDEWNLQEQIIPPNGGFHSAWGYTGYTATVMGDILIVASPGDSEDMLWAGSAFVFHFNGDRWVEQVRLRGFGSNPYGGGFGSDLAIDGDLIAVGSPDEFGYKAFLFELYEE